MSEDRPVERRSSANFPRPQDNSGVKLRAASPGVRSRTIGGYAAVFNRASENLGGFREKIDQRAFNKSRGDGFPDIVCRFNHKDDFILGTTRADTLRLSLDDTGLLYDVDLPNCREDVLEMTERGDVAHSSFAFQTYDDSWDVGENGMPMRTLLSVRLIDVAPVTSPAYPDATVGLRSLALAMDASFADVAAMAAQGELRSFFVRTDDRRSSTTGTLSGAEALTLIRRKHPALQEISRKNPVHAKIKLAETQARRWPTEPDSKKPLEVVQRINELMGKRFAPGEGTA